MAVSCDAASLSTAAKCLSCIPREMWGPVELYLLALAAGGSRDPATLLAAAKCFECIPREMEEPVELYLLAGATSSSTDAATLVSLSKCLSCIPPRIQAAVDLYLLATAAGASTDAATLVAAAKCFKCVPVAERSMLRNYLLCQAGNAGFGGGGGGGGSDAPTGFTFTLNAAQTLATAAWNSPPGAVTSVELWTSNDGVTYALAATVIPPVASTSVTAPTPGNSLFGKLRFHSASGYTSFTTPASVTASTFGDLWSAQVVANGGAAPSAASVTAVTNFLAGLRTDGILTKIAYVLGFAPDSLTAAITPIYNAVGGNNPATNVGPFLGADLTVNGLIGNGSTKYLKLGFSPSQLSAWIGLGDFASMLISIYCSDTNGGAGTFDVGAVDGTANHQVLLSTSTGGISIFDNPYNAGNGRLSWPNGANGLYTGNRTATNVQQIWFSAAIPGLQLTNNINQAGNPPPAVEFYAFTVNNNNGAPFTPINRRLSAIVFGAGLTAGEMALYGPRLRAFRTALGGGDPA